MTKERDEGFLQPLCAPPQEDSWRLCLEHFVALQQGYKRSGSETLKSQKEIKERVIFGAPDAHDRWD